MTYKKNIQWESWNVKEEELIIHRNNQYASILSSLQNNNSQDEYYDEDDNNVIHIAVPPIGTPFGSYHVHSVFKPSDNWDCWIGHTNFKITESILKILNEEILGIEALSILGAYTFCIGVAKMFNASDVKQEIYDRLCGEIHGNNTGRSLEK